MLTPPLKPEALADAAYTALERMPTLTDSPHSVRSRAGATVDETTIRMAGEAAVKQNTFPSRPGYSSGSAHWQTHLHLEAWVRNATFAKRLWADVHVFAHDGTLVSSETCPLVYERPAGDGGDLFQLDCVVYEGTTATPGSAEPRPDVRLVQYRLYGEMGGELFTDGLVHECVLRSDVISR